MVTVRLNIIFLTLGPHTDLLCRPVRILRSGGMTSVAASGFHNIQPRYNPPRCPHASDPMRRPSDCVMELHLRKMYRGRTVDYFRVPPSSHLCPFVGVYSFHCSVLFLTFLTVVIPPLNEPLFHQSSDEVLEEMGMLYLVTYPINC